MARASLSSPVQLDDAPICIVGLGLIGGSLALALRRRFPKLHLTAIDRQPAEQHRHAGAVHEYVRDTDAGAVDQALGSAHVVVLAAPVSAIRSWLPRALAHSAVVTDCGSTKLELVRVAQSLPGLSRFVPGHPMAGAGHASATPDPDLFVDRPWILCGEQAEVSALARVETLVTAVGAKGVHMTAADHDRAVAWTSHVPRIASSLVTVLSEQAHALEARGPAFERLLRSSGGSASVWSDVLSSNATEIARALDELAGELQRCAAELRQGGAPARTLAAFDGAERVRQALEAQRTPPASKRRS